MKVRNALLLGIAIIFLDYLSKLYVQATIPLINFYPSYPYGGIGILRNFFGIQFSIIHTTNTGAAWGALQDFPRLLVAIRILFVSILLGWVTFSKKGKEILLPVTLIVSGAIGNLIDFYIYGHVIDYIYFVFFGWPYPVFNLADSSIFIGVTLLFIQTYGKKRPTTCSKTG